MLCVTVTISQSISLLFQVYISHVLNAENNAPINIQLFFISGKEDFIHYFVLI